MSTLSTASVLVRLPTEQCCAALRTTHPLVCIIKSQPRYCGRDGLITGHCSMSSGAALAAQLPHLELGERPVGCPAQVRKLESVSLVWSETLHPAKHPLAVLGLLGLCDVLVDPGSVPGTPRFVLPHTDGRVRFLSSIVCISL